MPNGQQTLLNDEERKAETTRMRNEMNELGRQREEVLQHKASAQKGKDWDAVLELEAAAQALSRRIATLKRRVQPALMWCPFCAWVKGGDEMLDSATLGRASAKKRS